MSNKKKLLILVVPLLLLLGGCSQVSVENGGLWNFMVISLAKSMVFFGNIFGDNLGWGIITMTLIVRLVLAPLYGSQIKSSAKMKEIQPKINKLNQKYEGKKDSETQRKKSMEQQAIYKEAGVNPLAGCLPLLIQFPLLIAFYQAIEYLVPPQATIDQAVANGQEAIYGLVELGHENMSTLFFGIELNERVIIFAFLAGFTTWLATYVTSLGQDDDAPGAGMMKGMMFAMPIMIFFFGLSFPGALSIYWVVGNLVSIAQTLFYNRSVLQTLRQKKNILSSNNKK